MQQTATCSNCQTAFQTPGVLKGKTSAVVCPKCRRVVVVVGEMEAAEAEASGKKDEGGPAWKVRSEYDRPVVERPKADEQPASVPPPTEAPPPQSMAKMVGAAAFMVVCVGLMLWQVIPKKVDPEVVAKIESVRLAINGGRVEGSGFDRKLVVDDFSAKAMATMDPQQLCMNALFQGVPARTIQTQSGTLLADCSPPTMTAPPAPAPK
jgi:hypothetical protein